MGAACDEISSDRTCVARAFRRRQRAGCSDAGRHRRLLRIARGGAHRGRRADRRARRHRRRSRCPRPGRAHAGACRGVRLERRCPARAGGGGRGPECPRGPGLRRSDDRGSGQRPDPGRAGPGARQPRRSHHQPLRWHGADRGRAPRSSRSGPAARRRRSAARPRQQSRMDGPHGSGGAGRRRS